MTHVSPSQIATYSKCPRKWAYSRVRPRTQNKWAAFGTEVHRQRERWLTDSIPPDANTPEGRCALAGLEHLPMPGTCLVEQPVRFTHEGVNYLGYIDVLHDAGVYAHVQDHKSCGSFDYALSAEDLLKDPQWIIYLHFGTVALDRDYGVGTWHYLQRKPPVCRPVSMGEPRKRIAERFHELHKRYGLPIVQAAGIPPEEFPRNLDHCGAYGGCPYAGECLEGVSPLARAAAALGGKAA